MLASTATTEIRARIQELVADFWTSAEVYNAINEAVKRFSSQERWSWLQTVVTNGSYTANAGTFALPDGVDVDQAFNIQLVFSGDARPRRPRKVTAAEGFELLARNYIAQSEPDAYFLASASDADSDGLFVSIVQFVPNINRNATVSYIYHRVPTPVTTGTDLLDVPEKYAMGVVAYATGLLWLKELQDSRKAEEQFALYAQVVDDAKKAQRKLAVDNQGGWGTGGKNQWEDPDYVLSYRSIVGAGGLG